MTVSEAARWLREKDGYLILTHVRPDGDTLGSAAALALALQAAGKTAWLYPNPEITRRFLPYVADVLAPEGYQPQTVLAVDTASESMLPVGAEGFAGQIRLCIDHHPSNTGYAAAALVDAESAACGEIVWQIIREMQVPVTAAMAERLYVAVSTDTGCFQYNNTTPRTLRTAAELVEHGAPNGRINQEMFRTKPVSRIRLEGLLFAALEFYRDGQVAVMPVTRQIVAQAGADENAMEDLAALPGQVEGVLAAATMKELAEDKIKVSLRTRPCIDANAVCARFGGGGHALAAGCMIGLPMEEAKRRLLEAIDQEWRPV